MKQPIISMRPGTILGYKGEVWMVTANDTLRRQFTIRTIDPRRHRQTKRIQYAPGQEISIRWKPEERI